MNPVLQLIISQLPAFFAMVREARAKVDPNAPTITNEEVFAGLEQLFSAEIAKDQQIRAGLRAELGLPPA